MNETNPIFRLLSSSLLISSQAFSRLTASKQTEVLVGANGKPIVFVESFDDLRDGDKIAKKFLAGEDITTEIEFNSLTVTDEQRSALSVIKPLLAQLKKLYPPKPLYPYLEVGQISASTKSVISGIRMDDETVTVNGYPCYVVVAEKIWSKASKFWAGETRNAPNEHYETFPNGNRFVEYTKTSVDIGCQRIPRAAVEHIAKHYGWEPNITGKVTNNVGSR